MCIVRFFFLFIIYCLYFFYRSFFIIILRSEFFYFLYIFFFSFFSILSFINDKYIYYFFVNLYFDFVSIVVWFKNYAMTRLPFDSFFFFDFLEEPLWTFSYIGRSRLPDGHFSAEAEFSFGHMDQVPDLKRGYIFKSFLNSPFYSLPLLESVRRLYRIIIDYDRL